MFCSITQNNFTTNGSILTLFKNSEFLFLLLCFIFHTCCGINTIVFKWGSETPDLSKFPGEYTFTSGQVQLNIYNSGDAEAELKVADLWDFQQLEIGAK